MIICLCIGWWRQHYGLSLHVGTSLGKFQIFDGIINGFKNYKHSKGNFQPRVIKMNTLADNIFQEDNDPIQISFKCPIMVALQYSKIY